MRSFVWQRIDKLTDNYHEDGGLLIIAESLEKAYAMEPSALGIKPDFDYECEDQLVKKIIFPDAGCC